MSGESLVSGEPAARFFPLSGVSPAESVEVFEFDEADLWSAVEAARRWPSARAPKKAAEATRRGPAKAAEAARRAPASMPVSIPDWTGIARGRRDSDEEEEEVESEGDGDDDVEEEERKWVPPHVYLARQVERRRRRSGVVSCSVEEGSGRALKGRELWRVRDAIWEKIGFQD